MLVTQVYLLVLLQQWNISSDDELEALSVWDGYFHMIILPLLLMFIMSYISIQERFKKEQVVNNEFNVIKKVLASLSQGVALTVDFPERIR